MAKTKNIQMCLDNGTTDYMITKQMLLSMISVSCLLMCLVCLSSIVLNLHLKEYCSQESELEVFRDDNGCIGRLCSIQGISTFSSVVRFKD